MIRTSLFLGTLAIVTLGGFGCTQNQPSGTQNKTAYYHDRRSPIGSNIPKSYSDASSSADAQQSDLDRNSFQRSQTTFNSTGGGAAATGGR